MSLEEESNGSRDGREADSNPAPSKEQQIKSWETKEKS